MPKKYPQLSYSESVGILKSLGFTLKVTRGSHEQWVGIIGEVARKVTLQKFTTYDDRDIRSHISQSGVDRKTYYRATKRTAKKI